MASAANNAVLEADDRVLVIERVFDAPRELVWDAFTQTEHLMQWMGPRDHPAVSYEADARPGKVDGNFTLLGKTVPLTVEVADRRGSTAAWRCLSVATSKTSLPLWNG